MKIILTTLVASSIIFVGGCNKTKKTMTNSAVSQPSAYEVVSESDSHLFEMDINVEVESDGEQIVLTINGEEQVIDINDPSSHWLLHDFDVALQHIPGMNDNIMELWVSGDSDDDRGMRGHRMMRIIGGEGHEDMMRMHDQMMEMMGDREMPEEMHEMHERMMQMHEMQEQRPEHMRNVRQIHDTPEEHEFMQELGMMNEMSHHLSESGAISMLGIHMIRDVLEPEPRLEALERIIEGAQNRSPARNAALIVAIETLQELSRDDEAADLMVELVISNSHWDDDD